MDDVIKSMMALLWEHREYLESNGGNTNSISWIDDDIELVEIAYLDQEPDSDYQRQVAEEGQKIDFQEAFNLLHTRMINSNLFER